jgi:hypothetical protein
LPKTGQGKAREFEEKAKAKRNSIRHADEIAARFAGE